ncbi:syntaxin [Trypanosoma theileri]|uniref:Syntaxin n=1 Tax=Trypanosoma theileri TaxID=67003 RepID=A0A1X0NXA4_9TRYP|nr:syntaxin [Trypanosoma theileri]ORC89337.1 syntaxin [Trypanosoma theileri]
MSSSKDPFDESVSDLRELVAKAKSIEESVREKGLVERDILAEVKRILDAADEELELLKSVLQVIEQRNGKVGDHVFSVNEVIRRQRVVRDLETELKEIHTFRDDLEARVRDVEKKNQVISSSTNSGSNGFLLEQELAQKEEYMQQDIVLDRLSYGLQELRETGINVNDELQHQEVLLEEAQREVEGVQARLRAVNAKVDKLLGSMSNRNKICTIVCLVLTLLFLVFVVLA